MQLTKTQKTIATLNQHLQSSSLPEQLRLLLDSGDQVFIKGVQVCFSIDLESLRFDLANCIFFNDVPPNIKSPFIKVVVSRIRKIIKQTKDVRLLKEVLSLATSGNQKDQTISSSFDFSKQILEKAITQQSFQLFQIYLNHVQLKHGSNQNKEYIKSLLTLGKQALSSQQQRNKIKQKFKDVKTDQDLKIVKAYSIITLQRFLSKPELQGSELVLINSMLSTERNDKNQIILESLLKLDLSSIYKFIESSISGKLITQPTVKYEMEMQWLHPSFITKKNIVLFCRHLNQSGISRSLYLYVSKNSVIDTEKGIFMRLPAEAYPKTTKKQTSNLGQQIPDLLNFIRIVITSIQHNKPIYTPFNQLTMADKVKLLTFGYGIFKQVPQHENQQQFSIIPTILQSEVIPDGFALISKVLEGDDKVAKQKCKSLFSVLCKALLICSADLNNINRLSNSGIIQNIYKITTSYDISIELINDVVLLYSNRFRNILRACNKIQIFETEKMLQKSFEAYLSQPKTKINQFIWLLIDEHPKYEELTKNLITKVSKQILQKPQQYLKDHKNSSKLIIRIDRIIDLLNIRSITYNPQLNTLIKDLLKLRLTLTRYLNSSQLKFQVLHKDVQFSESHLTASIDNLIELLKSSQFKESMTVNRLTSIISLPIHAKLFQSLYSLIIYIKHQQKDANKIYRNVYQKILDAYFLMNEQRFHNRKIIQEYISSLSTDNIALLDTNNQQINLFKQESLFDFFQGATSIFGSQFQQLLKSNTRSPIHTASKIPLQGFFKSIRGIMEIIRKSKDKTQVKFYIDVLRQILVFKNSAITVQCYYYLYTTFIKDIFPITNKLFSEVKQELSKAQRKPQQKTSTSIKNLIESSKLKQDAVQTDYFNKICEFLDIFILRETVTAPWVFENNQNQVKFNNTKNLALGIYLDQFSQLVSHIDKDNIMYYEKLLKRFLTPNIERILLLQVDNNRRAVNLRSQRQVTDVLLAMGYSPQVAEMALNDLQQVNVQGALQWIAEHRQDLDAMQQEMILAQAAQKSLQKQKSQQSKDGSGLKEVEPQKFASQIKSHLKTLFKQHLISGLYGKYSVHISELIILCIQRYDKEQIRNLNYNNFLNYLIKQLHAELKQEGSIIKFDTSRVETQLRNLYFTILKCISKKDMRQQALKSNLMDDLVLLLNYNSTSDNIQEQERLVDYIFNCINMMIPKKTSVDISAELDAIFDSLVVLKSKLPQLKIAKNFWSFVLNRLNYPSSHEKLAVIIDLFFKNLQTIDGIDPGEVIDIILSSDKQFLSANIQAEIKSYFYDQSEGKIVSKLKRQFLNHFERYNNNQLFYTISKRIIKKKTQKLHNNKKAVYIIYNKDSNSYHQSFTLNKKFTQYIPNSIQIIILQKLYHSIIQKPSKQNLDLLYRVLDRFPLLRHQCIFQEIQSKTLLDYLIENIHKFSSNIGALFTMFGTRGGVIVEQKGKIFPYSSYLQNKIIKKFYETLSSTKQGNNQRYLTLCYLLQFKHFNSLSNIPISNQLPSLQQLLESQFQPQNQFNAQPLSLIYKQLVLKAISHLYHIADNDFSDFQSQLVLLPLIYPSHLQGGEVNKLLMNRLHDLQNLPLQIEELEDPNSILVGLQRLQNRISRFADLFRREASVDIPFEYLPIQPKNERKQSKISNPDKQQEPQKTGSIIKQEKAENKQQRFLDSQFQNISNCVVLQVKKQQKSSEVASNKVDFSKFIQSEAIPPPTREYKIVYTTKINECLIQRLNSLWASLTKPKQQKINQTQIPVEDSQVIESNGNNDQQLIQDQLLTSNDNFGRRISESQSHLLNQRHNQLADRALNHFERMRRFLRVNQQGRGIDIFLNTRRRESQPQQTQQAPLNQNQIEKALEQYVQEKKIQETKIQTKPVENKVEVKETVSQQKKQEPKQAEQKTEQPKQIEKKEQQKSEEKKQEVPPKQTQTEKKQNQQIQKPQQKTQQKQIEKQKPAQNKQEQNQQKIEQSQEPNINPPVQVPNQLPVPVLPRANAFLNPPRFRPLLQVFGVSQHFLRNNGVNQEDFDSLPEDVQTDTLFTMISSQNQQNEQSKQQQPANIPNVQADVQQNIPAQLRNNFISQTQLLIASIDDPEMRQQIFLQASPQVIATLPAHFQQQAELVRQRRMRQIAAQQQQQDIGHGDRRRRHRRNLQNLIYPTISKQLFQKTKQTNLLKIVKTLFYRVHTVRPILLESILQNKQNQQSVINTLIYILRNPLKAPEFPSEIKQKSEDQWKPINENNNSLTIDILNVLYRVITSSSYKDSKFLKEKFGYEGLCGIRLQPKQELLTEGLVEKEFHHPFMEILTYSLPLNLLLSAKLLQGLNSQNIPKSILKSIIQTFKSDSLPDQYVNSLKMLQSNPLMKQLFSTSFTQKNHPKIQVLAQLLKYSFSRVGYLKDLHLKALTNYKPEYNKFLNEIYRIYTLEQLKNIKGLEAFKNVHKQIIKDVLAHSNIFLEPISIILKLPFLIDFETKREIFYQKVQAWNQEGGHVGRLELRIDRANLFPGSYSQIMPRTKQQMRGKINISFEDEMAYDAGGPTREWFLLISRQMSNPNYALFEQSSSGNTYHPSSKSYANPDHLNYFRFIGRIVGKALMQKCLIDAYFTRSFYKLILGQDLDLKDMQSSDFNFYKSMVWIKENHIQDDFYRFAYDIMNFGKLQTIQLIPNGKNIEVSEANKHQFVQKICLVKMKTETHEQIKAFLDGFHELIPLESIQYFTAEQLELLISGLPQIDLEDLKQNTQYQGYQPTDKQILWFWQILETFDQEQLTKLVQFVTGTSKIPPQGFKGLRGMHGNQKISIHKDFSVDQLPKSHTCFNQLDLPEYQSKEIMQKKLKIALKWGSESFGFM